MRSAISSEVLSSAKQSCSTKVPKYKNSAFTFIADFRELRSEMGPLTLVTDDRKTPRRLESWGETQNNWVVKDSFTYDIAKRRNRKSKEESSAVKTAAIIP